MPELEQQAHATVVTSLKAYYALARNASVAQKQTIIQDETLKKIFSDFSPEPSPEMALYFCKVLIILSDHPQNAYSMRLNGYNAWIGTICDQSIPPKLVDKFLRVQTRLTKAQLNSGDDKDANPERKPKPAKRTSKELTFVLPALSDQQQGQVSQCVLGLDGCISVSFRTDFSKNETRCFVRCKSYVETRKVANEIIKVGFEGVEFLHRNDEGNEELFTFYRDESASPTQMSEQNLPQYLDENIEVFDPATAIVTNDYQKGGGGWFSSILSFW